MTDDSLWRRVEAADACKLKRYDKVAKLGGDYSFEGTVVCVFAKLSGKIRIVVEDDRGVLHIFSERNLTPQPQGGKS